MSVNLIPGSREPKHSGFDPKVLAWADALARRVSPDRICSDVQVLPAPRNRLHATEAMLAAEKMILDRFRQTGWQAERKSYTFTDIAGYRDYDDYGPITYPSVEGANIVAIKPGKDPTQALAVLAHYDTVRDSPGANDNTASVAALIELARQLSECSFQRTLVLAAVDMEELNLFGAKALAADLVQDFKILGVLNYETMAYTNPEPGTQFLPPGLELIYAEQVSRIHRREDRGDFTAIIYNGKATRLAAALAAAIRHFAGENAALSLRDPNDLPVVGKLLGRAVPAVRNFARSDHARFWEVGIPALMVTDTANFRYQHYHRHTDTSEKLDYERLRVIVAASALTLAVSAGLLLD